MNAAYPGKLVSCIATILLAIGASAESPGPASPTDTALAIYAHLTGRTVLRPGILPRLREFDAQQVPAETNSAILFIQRQLARGQMELALDGDLFVRVLPAGWKTALYAPLLERIKAPAAPEPDSASPQAPPGVVDLLNVPLEQALMVYSDLRGRTLLRPEGLMPVPIRFRTQSAMPREMVVYGLTVTLTLNGLALVDDGDKFVQVVPVRRFEDVQARAPKPEPGAPVIDPAKVPVFRPGFNPNAAAVNLQMAEELIAFYARLADRKFVPSEISVQRPVIFEVRTPMTKAELLYGIETLLALNGLVIVPGEDNSFRVERAPAWDEPTPPTRRGPRFGGPPTVSPEKSKGQ
jgi:hypothetical protein